MRAVVFGPSPLMQTALGILKGQELGQERVRAEEDRTEELAKRERGAQLGALDIAHRTITNDLASETLAQKRAKQARANVAARRLRSSEFNKSGWYGSVDDPADPEHDYGADYEREAKHAATKRSLMALGMPEVQADDAARHDVNQQAMADKQTVTRLARAKTEAEIARIKAQTARERATAAREARLGDAESKAAIAAATREARDRRREMQSVLTRRPTQRQFPGIVPEAPDTAGYLEALTNWRADSTERQGAADDAAADLRALVPGLKPADGAAPSPTGNPAHAAPEAEKQARVRTVNERLSAALQASVQTGPGVTLPPSVDRAVFESDSAYRAWVRRKLGVASGAAPAPDDDEIDAATDALLDANEGRAPTPAEVVAEIERRRRVR